MTTMDAQKQEGGDQFKREKKMKTASEKRPDLTVCAVLTVFIC